MKKKHIGIGLLLAGVLLATPLEEIMICSALGLNLFQAMLISGLILIALENGTK